ncbi:hypothetical protein LXL04_008285 [Taraxacum kok-saghyz]
MQRSFPSISTLISTHFPCLLNQHLTLLVGDLCGSPSSLLCQSYCIKFHSYPHFLHYSHPLSLLNHAPLVNGVATESVEFQMESGSILDRANCRAKGGTPGFKLAILRAAGGIGQPLSGRQISCGFDFGEESYAEIEFEDAQQVLDEMSKKYLNFKKPNTETDDGINPLILAVAIVAGSLPRGNGLKLDC